MSATCSGQPFRFLDLPAELRVRVYEIFFFEDVHKPPPIQAAREIEAPFPRYHPKLKTEVVVHTAPRQIHPYKRREASQCDDGVKPTANQFNKPVNRYPLAIFRVCRSIQAEAEAFFYGSVSVNLMGGQVRKEIASWEWLSRLPRRQRRLIRRVEHFCFTSTSTSTRQKGDTGCSLFDWSLFMKMLANECTALQSLKLWVHSDQQEYDWLARASETDPWINALFQLENLQNLLEFDMPGIRPFTIQQSECPYTSYIPDLTQWTECFRILPWLQREKPLRPLQSGPADHASIVSVIKARLECRTSRSMVPNKPRISPDVMSSFPILKLPAIVRARIYRHLLLPSNKLLYPYIGSWYDETTRTAVPLLLTCRQIREEAEEVLYGEAVFTVPKASRMDTVSALQRFFEGLVPRLRAKIRHVRIDGYGCHRALHFLEYLGEEMSVSNLTCSLEPFEGRLLAYAIENPSKHTHFLLGQKAGLEDFERIFQHFATVNLHVDAPTNVQYPRKICHWLASLSAKWTPGKERRKTLRARNPVTRTRYDLRRRRPKHGLLGRS